MKQFVWMYLGLMFFICGTLGLAALGATGYFVWLIVLFPLLPIGTVWIVARLGET